MYLRLIFLTLLAGSANSPVSHSPLILLVNQLFCTFMYALVKSSRARLPEHLILQLCMVTST